MSSANASVSHYKKGDILVREGSNSNSMYWVQSGTLRLYKKKGEGFIELGVVHSGEIVGEMSFLDNEPRSASIEALQPCDIIEIPRGKFDEVLAAQPTWMRSLVSTLVKRLRSTSNRVRELESSSTIYSVDEDGRTSKVHEFLSTSEQLKLSSALLLAGSRNSEKGNDGHQVLKGGWFSFYASQIFNVQLAKVQVFTDLMDAAKVIRIERKPEGVELVLLDLERLERFIYFAQDENAKIDDKQLPITQRGMLVLDAIHEFGKVPPAGPGNEAYTLNMEEVFRKMSALKGKKSPFDWNAVEELTRANITSELKSDDNGRQLTVQVARFHKLYPVMALRQRFRDLNTQKRESNS